MNYAQIYSLMNTVASEMWGDSAITVKDTSTFYSMGERVTDMAEVGRDKFLGVIADKVGRTVYRNLDASVDFPGLMVEAYQFGAMLEKIDVQPFEAVESNWVNVGGESFTPSLYDINKPNVSAKYFKDSATFQFNVTIPDKLFASAFRSEGEMDRLISYIMESFETSMTLYVSYLNRTLVNAAIAEKMETENNIINAVELYNTAYGLTGDDAIDEDSALNTPQFLRFLGKLVRDNIKYMSEPSVLYNDAGMVRATPRDNMHVLLATAFVSAYETNYQSDSFNKEMVDLPYFYEYKWLSGPSNTEPTLESTTTIKVKTKSGATVEASHIVGVLADRQAIFTGYFDRFSAADRNNRDRYTNYTVGNTQQSCLDLSENMCIIVLKDPTITPAA